MSGIWRILILSLILGVSSFTVGVLPLSPQFETSSESVPFVKGQPLTHLSEKRRLQLSTFGNGLLLGAALGVVIPESVYISYASHRSDTLH